MIEVRILRELRPFTTQKKDVKVRAGEKRRYWDKIKYSNVFN
jgi:hypothetical protein